MYTFRFLAFSLMASSSAFAAVDQIKVIYGADNRKDIYQSTTAQKKLAQATAGMVFLSNLTEDSKGKLSIKKPLTLEESGNICATEKFAQQPTAPFCSGFLIAPDIIVTAGHCYKARGTAESNCKTAGWLFDYSMKSANHDPTTNIAPTRLYKCKEVIAAEWNQTVDYAIIRLDRPVTGRTPLKFRTTGKLSSETELTVIGHPTGLPSKVSDKGRVTLNTLENTFSTTLDTFHGNSGSAVMDSKTGLVEGILIQGKTDYKPSDSRDPQSCQVVNICDDTGKNCSAGNQHGTIAHGEVVFRITKIVDLINKAIQKK